MQFLSTLAAVLLGGGVTLGVTWWQMTRVFKHERTLAREAADDARAAARQSITRESAIGLIRLLSEFQAVLPLVGQRGFFVDTDVGRVLDALDRAQVSTARLLPETVQIRWFHLADLGQQLRLARPEAVRAVDDSYWTEQKIGRAHDDVTHYIEYVRDSLVAVIEGREPPAWVDPPYLRRDEMDVWQWSEDTSGDLN
jgi:hypothetical protein